MNKPHYSKKQTGLTMRYSVLGGVFVVMGLIVYGIIQYPFAFTLSPVESIVYLALCMGLLSGYSWFALQRTKSPTPTVNLALRWGGWLGLAIGLCWWIELWAGNLADPAQNMLVWLAYHGSTLAVPLLTIMTAVYASRSTRLRQTGVWVGLWSGIVSAMITFSGLVIIAYSGALTHDPQTIRQALSNGTTNIVAYGVADSLVGAINHLWIGPLLGIVCGGAGGFIGAAGNQKTPSPE